MQGRSVIYGLVISLAGLFCLAGEGQARRDSDFIDREVAVLQGLDKITARVSKIYAPVGNSARFGALEITTRACRTTPPELEPEAAAFLQINELRQGERPQTVFSGWMFASSPALSAMEHPVYDVWVIDCISLDNVPVSSGARGNEAEADSASDSIE